MGTIRFTLRTDKLTKDGRAPIELIYQVQGQRKYFRTKEKIYPANWDTDTQRAIYLDRRAAKKLLPGIPPNLYLTDEGLKGINRALAGLVNDIEAIEDRYRLDRQPYSAAMVIDALKGTKEPETKKDLSRTFVFDFIDKYITDHAEIREKGSLQVYRSVANHLKAFQDQKREKITFEGMDYAFFQRFQNFLIKYRELNNTTVAKALSTLKTLLGYARLQGIEICEGYKDFKIKREIPEVIALTQDEFDTLYNLDLSGNGNITIEAAPKKPGEEPQKTKVSFKTLAKVRDVFCFACVTGLRYSDLAQLRREHIKPGEVRITVKKTKDLLTIPLNGYAVEILTRYGDQYRPLPIISNQKMNAYLKGLCELAGINEPVEVVRFKGTRRVAEVFPKYQLIGVHAGRKTFATLSLEKGMSAEEVMTITGHKDYKSFKRYVKITEERKKVVMLNAWGGPRIDLKVV